MAMQVSNYRECSLSFILPAIGDGTGQRNAERRMAELLQQKETLLPQMQHRVANSQHPSPDGSDDAVGGDASASSGRFIPDYPSVHLASPIVNVGPAPHMRQMTSRANHQADASHYAAAIARWDDEGGAASTSARSNTGARAPNEGSKSTAEVLAELKVDRAPENDKKILECLGAAVIMRWGTLPTKIQRELFENAISLADLAQTAPPKGQIARFLHNHKDEADRTPRRVVL
jgi:hypothetical protein